MSAFDLICACGECGIDPIGWECEGRFLADGWTAARAEMVRRGMTPEQGPVEPPPVTHPEYRIEPRAFWEVSAETCDRCGGRLTGGTSLLVFTICHDDDEGTERSDVVLCLPCAHDAAPKEWGGL